MTPTEFLTSFCQPKPTTKPEWYPLYADVALGQRAPQDPVDYELERAALKSFTGEARSQRAAYLLDLLNNTPDPAAVPAVPDEVQLSEMSEQDLTVAFSDIIPASDNWAQKADGGTFLLSQAEIARALLEGEDPLALNPETASYENPSCGCPDERLAIAQLCARFCDQTAVDRLLRPGAATAVVCERQDDVAPILNALLRFQARPAVNDFADPQPVLPATLIDLDRDRAAKKAQQALSKDPALAVMTSDPNLLTGVLAHLPIVHIAAPDVEVILSVLADVCSATGQMSTAAVRAALPTDAELGLLPRAAVMLALREKGPIRVARRMKDLAQQAGGAPAAARVAEERKTRSLAAAGMVVMSQMDGGDQPISIAMSCNTPVVQMQHDPRNASRASVTARLASLLAGEAMDAICRSKAGERSPRYSQARQAAVSLAVCEALGRLDGTSHLGKPDDVDAQLALSRDKGLQSQVSRRLNAARKRAAVHLVRNMQLCDVIAAHLLADGAVDAATLADLLVMGERPSG